MTAFSQKTEINRMKYKLMSNKVTLFKSLSAAALLIAVALEALPYGATLIFVPSPNENVIVNHYSYFDVTTFGYANFAPLITAILTVILTIAVFAMIFVKKLNVKINFALLSVIILTAIISVCPIFYGLDYVTVTGIFITLSIAASAAFYGVSLRFGK